MTTTLAPPPVTTRSEPPVAPPPRHGRMRRMWRGPESDPVWSRPALLALLTLTGVLYLWNLSASGYANSYYAAATQAGSQSWKAWFFGSLDAGNSITVDKPPASLWISGLSARLFGFTSWSVLVPQALEGVAAVGLLFGAVRRVAGPRAGVFAGAALALTPAAELMFRFNNPDALLTLLLVASAYAMVRALENASGRWLALAGSALGFAFLTKMLQGLLVLPAFALVYLVCAPTSLGRRIRQTLVAGAALVASAGWWVLAVALWPAGSRPYIGGSTNNSVLDLVFGYNGFGRLLGGDGNGGGGGSTGAAGSSFGGATGLSRLFSSEMGNEISWLLPASLVALVAGLIATRGRGRTDAARASLLMWGGWLVITGVVFSYMKGTIHPYYTVALAPAIAALVAIGTTLLWRRRADLAARVGLAAMVVAAGGWSYVLLARVPSWHPELRYLTLALSVLTALAVLVPPGRLGTLAKGVAVTGTVAALIGTAAFGAATAATAHTGSIPTVGPTAAATAAGGGMGGGMGGATGSGTGAGAPTGSSSGGSGTRPSGTRPTSTSTSSGSSTTGTGGAPSAAGSAGGGGATSTSTALTTALKKTTSTWAAAVVGDQSAADLELATGKSVISIGGWSGTDASPTLAQFEHWVAEGRIGYYIVSGSQGGGQGGSSGVASQIAAWVAANYTSTTIVGTTVYDLTSTS